MNEIDKNYEWFEKNYNELQKKYKNKFLIIQNQRVIKAVSNMEEAIRSSKDLGLELGTYIIQECAKDKEKLTQVFHTRVRFND